jgi:ComF family protein
MMLPFVVKCCHAVRVGAAYLHETMLTILAPPMCVRCNVGLDCESVLCASCLARFPKVASHTLAITKNYAVTVFAASAYQDSVQTLICAKLQRRIAAARQLGILIWEQTDISNQQFDYIVPVPLHWKRYLERGYNQADEIARVISTRSGKPVLNCIERIRATVTQAGLSADARAENVEDAFAIKKRYAPLVRNARILLVDDVFTTGSTIHACARALRMKRPASIIAAVAARVV